MEEIRNFGQNIYPRKSNKPGSAEGGCETYGMCMLPCDAEYTKIKDGHYCKWDVEDERVDRPNVWRIVEKTLVQTYQHRRF